MYAGIDIGYGYTKIAYHGKRHLLKTLVENYVPSDKGFNSEPDIITVNGRSYLVGPDASPTMEVTKDFVGTDDYFAVLGYSLGLIYKDTPDLKGIGLGLPPAMFNRRRVLKIKEQIRHLEIKNRNAYLPIPAKIEFIPQGVGAYIDYLSDNPDASELSIVVFDIGFYTMDVVHINKGQFNAGMSTSYPCGIEMMLKQISSELTVRYGEFIGDSYAEEILKHGRIKHFGKEYSIDVSQIVNDFYMPKLIKTIKEYSITLKDNKFTVDTVILTGGGAVYVKDLIEGVYVSKEPQFANARGYRYYVENK